jgi:hypothetical protein
MYIQEITIDEIKHNLAFIDSSDINVFPCGRRRSRLVDATDANEPTVGYLPFDPEARLNTEANHRKHSALNGYKQSYVLSFNSSDNTLSFVIGGYSFIVKLRKLIGNFAADLVNTYFSGATAIYANIKLEDIVLLSGTSEVPQALTTILRDQTGDGPPLTCLDLSYAETDDKKDKKKDEKKYYFSGLSITASNKVVKAGKNQQVLSLKILESVEDHTTGSISWRIPNESLLPNIDHGSVDNSIKVGIIEADEIKIGEDKKPVAMLDLVKLKSGNDTGKYQLQFTGATVTNLIEY